MTSLVGEDFSAPIIAGRLLLHSCDGRLREMLLKVLFMVCLI